MPYTPPDSDVTSALFASLLEKLDYLNENELRRVREAFRFADEAHLGQMRASGEPYITHPISVAALCAEWKLDEQAIMAALMHDAMEDCGITKTELIEKFGAPTAELVDGLTKLDKLEFSTKEESQAESFRKMLLAMARDVRVILIKLADRLHNMRTMDAMVAKKRSRIARETLDIYVPIAHRLGLNQTYRELQELSFQYISPWRHRILSLAVKHSRGYRRDLVERVRTEVLQAFEAAGMTVEVFGREKTIFSIYTKMSDKNLSFAQVNDIFGFRIVTRELLDCYKALGVLHQLYKPQPGRFKDYIAIAKSNGYQSLHTTLVNPLGTAVEFQVRSQAMHAIAEKGIAAHWMYKDTESDDNNSKPQHAAVWLQSLIDIQHETRDSAEFLEHLKIDLFPDSVYVFTPKSKILALPRGATAVDFAYAIHSDVGDHCVAASINGEPAALRTELKNGDVVKIQTSDSARPSLGWMSFVRTGRARSKIKHYLKNLEADESLALGQRLLRQAMRAEGLVLPTGNEAGEDASAQLWQALLRWSENKTQEELLIDIGLGRKIATMVAKRLAQFMIESGDRPDALTLTLGRYAQDDAPTQSGMVIDGSEGATVQLAPCCRPIPGDEVAGYLGRGEGLVVHRKVCGTAIRLLEKYPDHWLDVSWSDELDRQFETSLAVLVKNSKGVLAQVAAAIGSVETDITHIEMSNEREGDTAELKLSISFRDTEHLSEVLRVIRRCSVVLKADRVCPTPS